MTAYYNEHDPYAAQWLRNLIAAGHIAPGEVDERSIEDVCPDDIRRFTQCHFFAGIGAWSLALRRAGWLDDRPVWTGSAPCQPFSAAGAGAGFADERHLWPSFFHLISQCSPPAVFGEQVAGKDADPWIDLVQDDLEGVGYRVGALAFPSAGVGAPHIRDRLYWMAHTNRSGQQRPGKLGLASNPAPRPPWEKCRAINAGGGLWLGNAYSLGTGRDGGAVCGTVTSKDRQLCADDAKSPSAACGLADPNQHRCGEASVSGIHDAQCHAQPCRSAVGMAGAKCNGSRCKATTADYVEQETIRPTNQHSGYCSSPATGPGPTNGFWRDADWLLCRDGKWRPVEPGTFPLVASPAGSVGRVRADWKTPAGPQGFGHRQGRLKAYGNAINAEAARIFIEVAMSCMP